MDRSSPRRRIHLTAVASPAADDLYVLGPGDQRYCFSILCNDTCRAKGGTAAAHTMQDSICRLLTTWDQ